MNTSVTKASADVGNSSTKIIVTDGLIKRARKQPSVISYLPVVPKFEDDELDLLVTNLHKNIVVHVTSDSVAQNGLFAVGELANVHGGIGFNVRHHVKSERDITIIQPLAMASVTAIQNVFAETGKLPKTLEINLEYATAIPVVDYTKATAKQLENRLIGNHLMIVYVSEDHRVTVSINVVEAKVVQEGIPGFYALVNLPPSFFEAYNERYKVNFTGENFAGRKLLFIDIGEGTMELIYIVDGKPIVIKSDGVRVGVGHASEKALTSFKHHYKIKSALTRSKFMDKVLNHNDKWHDEASQELKTALFEQEQEIFDNIVDTIENVLSHDLDDVVVFGGGTNVFTNLEDQLINYTKRYKMRVLWIQGKESSLLNAIGLDELNNNVFFKK